MKFTIGIVVGLYLLFNLRKFLRLFTHRLKLLCWLLIQTKKHRNNFKFYIRSYIMFFCCNGGKYSNLLIYINGDLYNIKLYSSLRKVTNIVALNKTEWRIITIMYYPIPMMPVVHPEIIKRTFKIEYDLMAEKEYIESRMWNMPKVLNILPVLLFLPHPTNFNFENSQMLWGRAMLYGTYIYHLKSYFKYIKDEYVKSDAKLSLSKEEWKNIKKIYKNYHV